MANANFSLVQLPHHHATTSYFQFQHSIMSMLETFMHGHPSMMTFLYLKVHNGQCKFSMGLVSPSLCHCILGSVSIFKGGYAKNIDGHSCMMTSLHLKVHNGQCKFSIGLVAPSQHNCILGLVSTFHHGYA